MRPTGMRRAAAVLLLAAALATGCATAGSGSGSGAGSGPESPESMPPGSAPAGSAPAGSGPPSSALPTPPPEPTGTVTLKGVVERGVEPGCLVLKASGRSYTLLQGADATPATGLPLSVPVEVVATPLTGVASYCQQGTLLKVVRVTRG